MKVKDLIEILLTLNPEAEIVEPTSNMILTKTLNFYDEKGWIDETELKNN